VTMTRFLKGWDIIVVDEPRAWKFTNRSWGLVTGSDYPMGSLGIGSLVTGSDYDPILEGLANNWSSKAESILGVNKSWGWSLEVTILRFADSELPFRVRNKQIGNVQGKFSMGDVSGWWTRDSHRHVRGLGAR
jgi:hypothetical protein